MAQQTEAIDLPGAEIEDQFGTDTSHIVRVAVKNDTEVHYIIGQFQDRGYVTNGIDFDRNTVSFSKKDD